MAGPGKKGREEGRVKSSLPQAVWSADIAATRCFVVDGVVDGSVRQWQCGCTVEMGD